MPEMTDEQRQALRIGDRVRVRDDLGQEADYEVKYDPWQLGHGEWVIGLKGISGGYLLSRVVAKLPTPADAERVAGRIRCIAEFMEDQGIGVGDHCDAPTLYEAANLIDHLSKKGF